MSILSHEIIGRLAVELEISKARLAEAQAKASQPSAIRKADPRTLIRWALGQQREAWMEELSEANAESRFKELNLPCPDSLGRLENHPAHRASDVETIQRLEGELASARASFQSELTRAESELRRANGLSDRLSDHERLVGEADALGVRVRRLLDVERDLNHMGDSVTQLRRLATSLPALSRKAVEEELDKLATKISSATALVINQ